MTSLIPKNDPMKPKTPLGQKIALMIFGLFLLLVLLETGLRLGGIVFLSYQEHRNRVSISKRGSYSILCLGESTTANAWPPFLEVILNRSKTGVRFSVIDKGVGGIKTTEILNHLESNLDEFHPDMVIVMMGINDEGTHMPQEDLGGPKIVLFFKSFRTYKLWRLLWLHIAVKVKEMGLYRHPPPSVRQYTRDALVGLKGLREKEDHVRTKEPCHAEEISRRAIEQAPVREETYVEQGNSYLNSARYAQAEEAFRRAIEQAPASEEAYVGLGLSIHNLNREAQAEEIFRSIMKTNPRNCDAPIHLGWNYQGRGKYAQAEEIFRKAIEGNPTNRDAYVGLGVAYLSQDKYAQAEEILRKALERDPENAKLYGALRCLYEETGRTELAREFEKKAKEFSCYDHITVSNYRRLREILDKRKIKSVFVQYPMRSVEPLKKIFVRQEGLVFVDNEKVFKKAVKEGGYKAYFLDMIGGDFGHCTKKGNLLLAENIAAAVLREYFH